eukprot:CAMPEP_0177356950 /NCGR_PEP_ID=MMETSP0368-20130122/34802_1 /TAXON_ID=447022 ORGANISM="Scrippsiella hangoei-like, Strain SHHI-4" /NCGR_SAMPLE_ID=MMETSP0368 /ASSEMBLY_ACC=CAM_ASM_000363 /LENGTH=151 /DNA_ID=CAMNT_0018819323 /DNA_START=58 /DNA_END=514 /DNA_ORIENTATION=-
MVRLHELRKRTLPKRGPPQKALGGVARPALRDRGPTCWLAVMPSGSTPAGSSAEGATAASAPSFDLRMHCWKPAMMSSQSFMPGVISFALQHFMKHRTPPGTAPRASPRGAAAAWPPAPAARRPSRALTSSEGEAERAEWAAPQGAADGGS